jgi:flagellar hook-associated protein 2
VAISPLAFTGVSSFSNDFQTILNRAVSIAQLPITILQNHQSDLLQKKQLATNLESAVSDLATSVSNLGSIGASQGLAGSSSDTTKVVVNSTSATTPVSYAITNISSVAKSASETSALGYADGTTATVSTTGTMRLVIGGNAVTPDITLDAAHNNLTGLRDAINALGAGVTASVLTTGTGATPYYLSVSATSTGQNAIQLVDDPTGAATQQLTSANPGANADFYVNGAHVVSASNLINSVVPGMTFTIAGQTAAGQTVTLSAASDPTQISAGLQDFVTKYNAVASQLSAQYGPAAGMLSGNPLIWGIQAAMRGLVNYNGTGVIKSLSALGIEVDSHGQMTFNQTTSDPTQHIAFNSLSSAQIAGAFSFLGSATAGFGALSAKLTQFSDPITGAIKAQQDQFDAADTRISDQVTAMTARVNAMQTTLSAKLQAADTQLAQMQSQQQLLTSTIQSLNFATYGYQNTNSSTFSPNTGSGSNSGG